MLAQGLGQEAVLPAVVNLVATAVALSGIVCALKKQRLWVSASLSVIGIALGFLAVWLLVSINWLTTLDAGTNLRQIVDHMGRSPVSILLMALPVLLGAVGLGLGWARRR